MLFSLCVVNIHCDAEYYNFDEFDEIKQTNGQLQESISLSDTDPSHYLKHQQNPDIIYANRNSTTEETKL